jgi:SpoIID/LytB domain protein
VTSLPRAALLSALVLVASTAPAAASDAVAGPDEDRRTAAELEQGAPEPQDAGVVRGAVVQAQSARGRLPLRQRVRATSLTPLPDVVFSGAGWGHSVGLSQYGAYEKSRQGRDHVAILRHYLPGAEVATVDLPGAVNVQLFSALNHPVRIISQSQAVPWMRCDGGSCQQLGSQPAHSTWRVERLSGGGMRVLHGTQTVFSGGTSSTTLRVDHRGRDIVGPNPNVGRCATAGVAAERAVLTECRYRRGYMEIANAGNGLRVHQRLQSMQDYLYGLGEMPANWGTAASGGFEALKAQAVAGRGFAAKRASQGVVNIGATAGTQVYLGAAIEAGAAGDRWTAAVDATRGQLLRHNGQPIDVYYSSSHGGRSENIEDSWAYGSQPVPYFTSVEDPWSTTSLNASYRSWQRSQTNSAFASRAGLGRVTRVEILDRTPGGTPRTLRVSGATSGGAATTVTYSGSCKGIAGASIVFSGHRCRDSGAQRFLPSQQVSRIGFPPFTDDDGHVHEYSTVFAAAAHIAQGQSSTRFAPSAPVTRGQMATFLFNTFDIPAGGRRFVDVAGHTHEQGVNAVAAAGIADGYEDGTFRPDEPVTRQQMATFLDRALGLPAGAAAFGDVGGGSTHARAVNAVAAARIASGCAPERFCPGDEVSRGQMATFLHQAVQWSRS